MFFLESFDVDAVIYIDVPDEVMVELEIEIGDESSLEVEIKW